jgi:hypothetical protein
MQPDFLNSQLDHLEDTWHRRAARLDFTHTYQAFGFPVSFACNHPVLLEAARISAERFSRSPWGEPQRNIRLEFLLDERLPGERVPEDWPSRLRYQAVGSRLSINAEPWVNAFADLNQRHAVCLISPSLSEHPRLYSRFIADSFTLNMVMRDGLGQLHASCAYRDGKAILFSAPHNTGKSTTALRLALNGYQLLTDGMTYIRLRGKQTELLGYPVGEVKLRLDTVDQFPGLIQEVRPTLVREDKKVVVNLRQALPGKVLDDSIFPQETVVCVVKRPGGEETRLDQIQAGEALVELVPESTLLDETEVMQSNLDIVARFLQGARCYRLTLGSDETGLLEAVAEL